MKREFNKKSSETLRISTLHGHDVHVVEGDNPKSMALLAKTYKEVYEAAFPMEEERESLESWVSSLQNKQASLKLTISILGDDLDKPNPTIKAMTVGCYYSKNNVGLLAYIVTAPQYQRQGLGRSLNAANNEALMQLAKNNGHKNIKGIFFEVNDPEKIKPEDDVMDPTKRVEMYKRWGAAMMPITYVQPPLETGGQKCNTLRLMAFRHPKTGKYPTKDAIKSYLNGIYTELSKYAGCPPEKNPDYIISLAQLDKIDLGKYYKTRTTGTQQPKPPRAA